MAKVFQTAMRLVFPPACTICGDLVEREFGLCGPCWRDTPFIAGLCCETCGTPLPGPEAETPDYCDDCLSAGRPWRRGQAAMLYRDNGRKLVLALKHGDRHDLVRPAGQWMARAAAPLLAEDSLIVPVPLHWRRLLRRRFNQSALLAREVARRTGHHWCPDLLIRPRPTRSLEGLGRADRFAVLEGAMALNPRHRDLLRGRPVLLVDDVMTSGATLTAAAGACAAGGCREISILTLARAGRDA